MKNDLVTALNRAAESARGLHCVNVGEHVNLCVGIVDSASAVEDRLASASERARGETLTVVLGLSIELRPTEAAHVLERANAVADTVVLIASADEHRRLLGSPAPADLAALAGATGEKRVFIEPDAERAVAAAMQWLRPGHACCVLWPRSWGVPALKAAITCGVRWRAAWDDLEEGEFHVVPRGTDGACVVGVRTPVRAAAKRGRKPAKRERHPHVERKPRGMESRKVQRRRSRRP